MIATSAEKFSKKTRSGNAAPQDDEGALTKPTEQYTVFLVEDDADDRHLTMQTLKKSPYIYNVHCFASGDKLVGHLASEGYYSGNLLCHLPVLIMMDIHMPGASGLDVLRELKEHPLTENIPVIMLTGDLSNKAALDAYKFHANAFITKPLNLDHVHEVIYTGWGWPGHKNPS